MPRECVTHFHACDCREAEFKAVKSELADYKNASLHSADDLFRKDAEIARLTADRDALQAMIDGAPQFKASRNGIVRTNPMDWSAGKTFALVVLP